METTNSNSESTAQQPEQRRYGSMVLGILSIVLAWFSAIVGLILGIIGLSIKKDPIKGQRDKTLNVIGIICSIISWIIAMAILSNS